MKKNRQSYWAKRCQRLMKTIKNLKPKRGEESSRMYEDERGDGDMGQV